jgi:hypothetical protein
MTVTSYRVAAVAAVLSAVTTILLWLLPRLYTSPQGFAEIVHLYQNPTYMARLWVNFVHIFFALLAYAVAAALLWRRSPILAGFGLICFLLWGFVELVGVSTNIFAVNFAWRAQFASAPPEVQAQLKVLLLGFPAVWDALFFVLLSGFLVGTFCFGVAATAGNGLERWVGVLFLLAVPLTLAIMLGGYASVAIFDGVVSSVYPVLQPISRALLGFWLWREGANNSFKPTPLRGAA